MAFFSLVDIDQVLRKEPGVECVTPTNPEPIPPGTSLNIYQLLEALGSNGLGQPDPAILYKVKSLVSPADRQSFAAHPSDLRQWQSRLKLQIAPRHLAPSPSAVPAQKIVRSDGDSMPAKARNLYKEAMDRTLKRP